jgi:hypothetical protein
MQKRKPRWALAGLALLAAGAFVLWPQALPPSRVTRENFDRIRIGMSWAEVKSILGPSGDYATGEAVNDENDEKGDLEYKGSGSSTMSSWHQEWWWDDRMAIRLSSETVGGDVVYAACWKVKRVDRGSLNSLLWRAKCLWRRWFPE